MTVLPGFWPGLTLGVVCLVVWWQLAGHETWQRWNIRQTLLRQGFCPDCAMPRSRCTCIKDFDL